jgi:hypothetical protein
MFSLFHSSILTYLGCFVCLNFWYHYNALYKESYGVLKMTNPKDHVLVMGDFVMQNY